MVDQVAHDFPLLCVETVTHELANGQTATERRVYQNSGANLDLGDQIIGGNV